MSDADNALIRGHLEAGDLILAHDRLIAAGGADGAARDRLLATILERIDRPAPAKPPKGAPRETAIFFSGRMFREDPQVETWLKCRIADQIDRHGVTAGFGSLACGADILVAEALQARGLPVHVVLASPAPDFIRTSVANGGAGWVARFDACLAAAAEVLIAGDSLHADAPPVFALTARLAMGLAVLTAGHSHALRHLAILGGATGQGVAGTDADTRHWRALGYPGTRIEAEGLARPEPGGAAPGALADGRAMSFLTVDLADALKAPGGMEALTAATRALSRPGDTATPAALWGMRLILALPDPVQALARARDLLGLPATGSGLRLWLHHGIASHGPVPGLVGGAADLTTRIAARVPPGRIYATRQFLAAASCAPPAPGAVPLGRVPLTDGGVLRAYRIDAAQARSADN